MPRPTNHYRHANCSRCKRENVPFYISTRISCCIECHRTVSNISAVRSKVYVRPPKALERVAFALFCKVERGSDDLDDQHSEHAWSQANPDVRTRYLRAAKALELKSTGT